MSRHGNDRLDDDMARIMKVVDDIGVSIHASVRDIAGHLVYQNPRVAGEAAEIALDRADGWGGREHPRPVRNPLSEARVLRTDPRQEGTAEWLYLAVLDVTLKERQSHPRNPRVKDRQSPGFKRLESPGDYGERYDQIRADLKELKSGPVGARPLSDPEVMGAVFAVAAGHERLADRFLRGREDAAPYIGFLARLLTQVETGRNPAHGLFSYMALNAGRRGAAVLDLAVTDHGMAAEGANAVQRRFARSLGRPIPATGFQPVVDEDGPFRFTGARLGPLTVAAAGRATYQAIRETELRTVVSYLQALRLSHPDMARDDVRMVMDSIKDGDIRRAHNRIGQHLHDAVLRDWYWTPDDKGGRSL